MCFSYLSLILISCFCSLLDPTLSLVAIPTFGCAQPPKHQHLPPFPAASQTTHTTMKSLPPTVCRSLWGWAPGSDQQVSQHQIPGISVLRSPPAQRLPGLCPSLSLLAPTVLSSLTCTLSLLPLLCISSPFTPSRWGTQGSFA